ncbi:hypothetical protein GEV49_32715 [Streptomyces sp. SYP-A7193]|nr:hypothetical protein GEV49_32715 [Streptomyces sp. SYP-A7193]
MPSWPGTGPGSHRCPCGRRCGPSVRSTEVPKYRPKYRSTEVPKYRHAVLSNCRSLKNHSTCDEASAMIGVMFRYAFHLAASAVADAPKAAVAHLTAAVDGARS